MTPGASVFDRRPAQTRGTRWASVIAVVFAAVATISFAVDLSVALTDPLATDLPSQITRD